MGPHFCRPRQRPRRLAFVGGFVCFRLRPPAQTEAFAQLHEQTLSADIASGKNTDLSKEAHYYLEQCIVRLRKELFGANPSDKNPA